MLELDRVAQFNPEQDEAFFASLPSKAAVFRIEMREGGEPYLGRTADLRRRMERLLRAQAEPSKKLNLRVLASGVRYRLTASKFEQSLALYQQAREHFPKRARDFLRLRPPALLKLNLENAYPRCYVTRRVISDNAFYFGPFPSRRAADYFASEFLNLFKIRRCQIKIRRDPSYPGCIYSEMKMCLAPCFAGCSPEEYGVEVARVGDFLASAGDSHQRELEHDREAASAAEDFERAAAVHKKIEKVAQVLRALPDLPRRIEELNAVILQRSLEEGTVAAYAVRGGIICDPFYLRFGAMASDPRSVETILRESLGPQINTDEHGFDNASRSDHLSLLARWYYSKPRHGEIFFRENVKGGTAHLDWPYRRILRACSRVLRGEQSAAAPDAKSEPPLRIDPSPTDATLRASKDEPKHD